MADYGIAVKTTNSAGGTHLAGGQAWFTLNDKPVVLLGDPVQNHGNSPHNAPTMTEGSSWLTLNGIPVVRAGNHASCGHVSNGLGWFTLPG